MKEELKRLKFFELSLKEQIKDLSLQRDGLIMELQQLQEAKPVLEKAYAVSSRKVLLNQIKYVCVVFMGCFKQKRRSTNPYFTNSIIF